MKKLANVVEVDGEGLVALLGERVILLCANYFYTGKLTGVNEKFVQLEDPAVVYETGEWSASKFKDEQKLHTKIFYVSTNAIESFGVSK